jgi:hypothetical protein
MMRGRSLYASGPTTRSASFCWSSRRAFRRSAIQPSTPTTSGGLQHMYRTGAVQQSCTGEALAGTTQHRGAHHQGRPALQTHNMAGIHLILQQHTGSRGLYSQTQLGFGTHLRSAVMNACVLWLENSCRQISGPHGACCKHQATQLLLGCR